MLMMRRPCKSRRRVDNVALTQTNVVLFSHLAQYLWRPGVVLCGACVIILHRPVSLLLDPSTSDDSAKFLTDFGGFLHSGFRVNFHLFLSVLRMRPSILKCLNAALVRALNFTNQPHHKAHQVKLNLSFP